MSPMSESSCSMGDVCKQWAFPPDLGFRIESGKRQNNFCIYKPPVSSIACA